MIENFLQIDQGLALGCYQNLYVTAWWDEATVDRLSRLREHRKKFLTEKSGPVYSLSLLYQTKFKLMPKESRTMIEELNRDGLDRFVGEAYYVNAGGLLITSMRFILSGLRLVNRVKTPLEVFGDPKEAARWLATQSKITEANVLSVVDHLMKQCGK
jgi:hypothetical protein